MRKCKICQNLITNERTVCKQCSQKKRSLKYYLNSFDDMIDLIFSPAEKQSKKKDNEETVIAS